ncbi:MAG: hypothetical protein OXC46_04780 [Thaumarchaeota archaeon]|nr:hypothetical protein [Nitrososphaerota archaeon]
MYKAHEKELENLKGWELIVANDILKKIRGETEMIKQSVETSDIMELKTLKYYVISVCLVLCQKTTRHTHRPRHG